MPVHGLHIWRHPLDLRVQFRYRRVKFGKCLSRGILTSIQYNASACRQARRNAYLALLPAEDLKVNLDSIIVHALGMLCRAILSVLFLINVHSDFVA